MRRTLFKYYNERRWAEAFLDGQIRFHSLSHYRDIEDGSVRGDENEGTSIYRPSGGLQITNHTRGTSSVWPGSFEAAAKADEIFVLCTSTAFTDELWSKFEAAACVEITRIKAFCDRFKAALPSDAKSVGRRVDYYSAANPPRELWALPDLIATSKFDTYRWQYEYRFVFSLTDALDFEKVSVQLAQGETERFRRTEAHPFKDLNLGSLGDICRLREWGIPPL
jgi:hypothetical protein